MSKLYNFGLKNGMWGMDTMENIKEMCTAHETEINKTEEATYDDIMDFGCSYGTLDEGVFECKEGFVVIDNEIGIDLVPYLQLVK